MITVYSSGLNIYKWIIESDYWCRFVPDKEFSGADRSGGRREGPVQFEKDEEEDIFGLNKFLTAAKKGQKRPGVDDIASSSSKDHERKKSRRD